MSTRAKPTKFTRIFNLVARAHWLILLAIAPLVLFVSPTSSPVLLIIPFLWIACWFTSREFLPRTPLNMTLLVLLIMVLVSTWATYDLAISLPKIGGVILGFGIYFAVEREGRYPRGWWISFILFLGMGLGIAALGFLGTPWSEKFAFLSPITSRLALRVTGVPGAEEGFNPNYVGGALLWVIPSFILPIPLLLRHRVDLSARFGRGRVFVFLLGLLTSTFLVLGVFALTQSRGAYLAFATIGLGLVATVLPHRPRYSLMVALSLGVVLFFAWDWQNGTDSLLRVMEDSSLQSVGNATITSAQSRLEIWSRAIYGIQDFPFTGMGMNTFRYIVPILYPLFTVSASADIGHAHNEFLQAALDLGIPGLIAFIALYIGAFWMLWRIWIRSRDSEAGLNDIRTTTTYSWRGSVQLLLSTSPTESSVICKLLVLALGGGLVAHLIWGMTDAMALGSRPSFLFWVLLGLVSALYQLSERSGPAAVVGRAGSVQDD